MKNLISLYRHNPNKNVTLLLEESNNHSCLINMNTIEQHFYNLALTLN